MPSEFIKSQPVTLVGSTFDTQSIDSSQEKYYAYQAGLWVTEQYDSAGARYSKNLSKDPTNSDVVGTFTNTFYNEPIGTHPGSSLSLGSVATTLYIMTDSAEETQSMPIGIDSSGDIYEMDSASFIRFGQRLTEHLHSNEYPGSFRLGSSAPNADYSLWESNVFTDTKSGKADVVYNIYRKTTQSSLVPSAPSNYILTLVDSSGESIKDIQETTLAQAKSVSGNSFLRGQGSSGVGDYLLLPSSQTPNGIGETGTWVVRGTATDTRNDTTPVQYASAQYTSAPYSSQYTRESTGQYTGQSFVDEPNPFYSGFAALSFAGSRDLNFLGTRTFTNFYAGSRTFTGNYLGQRSYTNTYVGTRNFTKQYSGFITYTGQYLGSRNFAGQYANNAQYTSSAYFIGTTNYLGYGAASYLGVRYYGGSRSFAANFAGTTQYTGTRTTNFAGTAPAQYAGPANFAGTRTFIQAGFPEPTEFVGTRQFAGVKQYAGVKFVNYEGVRPWQWTGPIQYLGSRAYAGNYAGPANFLGFFPANYIGPIQYLGTRQFTGPIQYPGSRNYTNTYVGTRNFTRQYTGFIAYTGQYLGARVYTNTYAGTRGFSAQYAGSRNVESNFLGTYTNQYAPNLIPTLYSNQYTGIFTSQYTAQFTSQFSSNYTGLTLIDSNILIETYTLYCKISES